VLYVAGTSNRLVSLEANGGHPVEFRWLTGLSDEYEAVFAEPSELDIKGIYSVE
jgi:hypothetical protein